MNQDNQLSREQREQAIARLKGAIRAAQNASDIMDEAFTDFLGINRTDGRCLDVVDRHGQVTAGELASEVGLTTGAVTAMVDRLELAGLLERRRDKTDRRKVLIQLTSEARTLTKEVYGEMARATAPYVETLSDHDLLTIIAFLETGRRVNLELAEAVRGRTGKRKASLRYRIEQARALKNDAKALFKTMKKELKEMVSVVVITGDSHWEQDESGRWIEVKNENTGSD